MNLLESNKVSLLCHIDGLHGTIQPHLDLRLSCLGIELGLLVLSDQDLTGITQENAAASQFFDVADRLLNFSLVLASIELLVNGVLHKEVQHWVLGDIPQSRARVCQERKGINARLKKKRRRRDGKHHQRAQDG
jgi:hypothetical protein